MEKLLRILRSRYFVAALCITLEFAQLIAVFVLLYEYVWPITILAWIFHVGVLLYIINRDDIPEFKLPWLIVMFLLPVLGAYVFMLFTSNDSSKKLYDSYDASAQALLSYWQPGEALEQLRVLNPEAFSQANYLQRSAGMSCYSRTATRYFPLGEAFHEALLCDLKQARRFIYMEYFIVEEGEMWNAIHEVLREKAAAGVDVYFMYDDFGCMTTLPGNYYKTLAAEGIHCIPSNKFTPILSHIHNNRDHRKITVIDGRVGYTGGINLADEYINVIQKYGHWKDTAVRLEGEGVRNLTLLFLANWNSQSKEPISYPDVDADFSTIPEDTGYVFPFGDGPEPIYQERIGKNVYLNMIHAAKEYLYITTPYLICDHELLNALRLAARKGVDVRIITPHIPDKETVFLMTRSNYAPLLQAGVKIYEYSPGFIHAKSFVCDNQYAVCGTINLDYRSLVHHFECGVWMYATSCIEEMKTDFLQTAAKSQRMSQEQAQFKLWKHLLAEVLKAFSPLL